MADHNAFTGAWGEELAAEPLNPDQHYDLGLAALNDAANAEQAAEQAGGSYDGTPDYLKALAHFAGGLLRAQMMEGD